MSISHHDVCGVVLAGGLGRRLGGKDKGLLQLHGKSFVEHIVDKLSPQVGEILINANRNQQHYAAFGKVIQDELEDYQGPLAGMLAAMNHTEKKWIVTVPCDGISIPGNIVTRLCESASQNKSLIATAHDGTRLQPVHAIINCSLRDSLHDYLMSGNRKIDRWYEQHQFAIADFRDTTELFCNVNTPTEKEELGAT